MAALGYLEVLDAAGHVRQRVAVHALPFSIGRGFASDLLLDDACVAARHATLACDPEGSWHLIDADTRNRLQVAGETLSSVTLTEQTTVVLGQTRLRFRAAQWPVADEQALPAPLPTARRWHTADRAPGWPAVLLLTVVLMGLEAGRAYFAAGAEQIDWAVGLAALEILGIALVWGLSWSLLSRLFTGHAQFWLHLLIGLIGLLSVVIAAAVLYLGAFAFDFAWGDAITSALACALLGGTLWLHLRTITPAHRLVCTLGSIGVALALIALDASQQFSETGALFSPTDRLEFLPPALRVRSAGSLDEFLGQARALREAVDAKAR